MGKSLAVGTSLFSAMRIACLALIVNQGAWAAEAADATAANGRLVADNSKSKPARQEMVEETDREAIVLQLVRSHLPELGEVLKQLRKDRPREYAIAIRDLSRAARKLELAKNRDERLFDIEVELLQAENQASLLIAKLKVRDSKSDRAKLRLAAERLQRAQLSRAQYDVAIYRQRLARSQQQLDSAVERLDTRNQDPDGRLEKTYSGMLRKAGRSDKAKPPSRSSSSNRSAEKPTRKAPTRKAPTRSDPTRSDPTRSDPTRSDPTSNDPPRNSDG